MTAGASLARSSLPTIDDAPGRYARFAGCLYLVVIAAGLFSEGYVRQSLLRSGDPLGNVHAIAGSPGLWTAGAVVEFLVVPCALVQATIEYRLLKPVHRDVALAAFAANLVSIALEAGNKTLLVLAGQLASGGDAVNPAWMPIDIVLRAHTIGFDVSLVTFGFACLPLGYLIFRSGFLPRAIGVAMGLAGVGYLVGAGSALFFPSVAHVVLPALLIVPFLGELSFCLWLILRGIDVVAWRERQSLSRTFALHPSL